MTDEVNIDEYIVERGNGMVRCRCGLAVTDDKMKMHLESEHMVKVVSDANNLQKYIDERNRLKRKLTLLRAQKYEIEDEIRTIRATIATIGEHIRGMFT